MFLYYQALISSNSVIPTPTPTTDRTFVVLGDSISRGTSNGVGNADAETLYEFTGGDLTEVVNDVQAAATGSWMPVLANRIKLIVDKKTNVSTNGSGGSEFSPYLDNNNWSTTGSLYAPMKTEAESLSVLKPLTAFIIILGINDARGTSSLVDVENNAISLIDRLNADFDTPKIYMVQIGRSESGVTSRVLSVRGIIEDLVATYDNVQLAASLATFSNAFFYDNLHLNQLGNDILGRQIADFILNDIETIPFSFGTNQIGKIKSNTNNKLKVR